MPTKNIRLGLILLGSLAIGACATNLALMTAPPAFADDDDDGGAQAGQDRPGQSFNGNGGRNAKKKKGKRKVRRPPQRERPVMVAMDLDEADLQEVRRLGFQVLRSDRLQSIGLRVELLRLPRNIGLPAARRILEGLGATATDVNSRFRPQAEDQCAGQNCLPFKPASLATDDPRICTSSPTLGLIETRVDTQHQALSGQPISVFEFRPSGSKPSSARHGTAISLILVGARNSAMPGLLPDASVVVAVPFFKSASGDDLALAYDVVRSIDALVAGDATVINMSLAGPANDVVERAVKQARGKGIPVVAAVGNAGARAKPLFPAAYDSAIAVTAVSTSLRIYRRAGQGDHVDFSAPGVEIEVEGASGRRELKTGTSFAVPYVSSALAALRVNRPHANVSELVSEVASTARDLGSPGKDKVFGWGLVQRSSHCSPETAD